MKSIRDYTFVQSALHAYGASIAVGFTALIAQVLLPSHSGQALDLKGSFFVDFLFSQFRHLSWNHLLLNLTGLAILTWGFQREVSSRLLAWVWLWVLLGTAAYLRWLEPIAWYCGLSGALHGVFVAMLLNAWNRLSTSTRQGWTPAHWALSAMALGLQAKLLLEWVSTTGPDPWVGGPVAVEAHRGGTWVGLVAYALLHRKR